MSIGSLQSISIRPDHRDYRVHCMNFVRTTLVSIAAVTLFAACGKPAPESTSARDAARRIADEKVVSCALAKTGKEDGMTFIADPRYENGWGFEYEGDGRTCEVFIGDDGTIEVDKDFS